MEVYRVGPQFTTIAKRFNAACPGVGEGRGVSWVDVVRKVEGGAILALDDEEEHGTCTTLGCSGKFGHVLGTPLRDGVGKFGVFSTPQMIFSIFYVSKMFFRLKFVFFS